jgi:hypothetical protein
VKSAVAKRKPAKRAKVTVKAPAPGGKKSGTVVATQSRR